MDLLGKRVEGNAMQNLVKDPSIRLDVELDINLRNNVFNYNELVEEKTGITAVSVKLALSLSSPIPFP